MNFDVVVVGGGIQGVGVAQAASAAGYSVLLLEKQSLAAATSQQSSKLIHGGLRYLESMQFSLVRESLKERALLLELAPDLVHRVDMHIPVYRTSVRSSPKIGLGLWLYRLLAGFDDDSEFTRLHRSSWADLDGLRTEDLVSVYRYREAQTDDQALTQAVWASAESLGAELLMPAEFVGAECFPSGCDIRYLQNGEERTVEASVLVNCAGPWGNSIIERVSPQSPMPKVELVQGAHLLLPQQIHHHFYLESPSDQRAIFALPWKNQLLLGTTETPHHGDPGMPRCLPEEREYLLATLQHYFPELVIEDSSITDFAGLRVLPKTEGSAFGRSREVVLQADNADQLRLLSVMGGKLTTYRATAEQVVDKLRPSLPSRRPVANTAKLPLTPA